MIIDLIAHWFAQFPGIAHVLKNAAILTATSHTKAQLETMPNTPHVRKSNYTAIQWIYRTPASALGTHALGPWMDSFRNAPQS